MNLTIPIKKLEKAFGIKVRKNTDSIGLDCASRTGWARLKIDTKNANFECGIINIDSTDRYEKYNYFINAFESLICTYMNVIIEESFFGQNVHTFQLLSRLGAFAYSDAVRKKCKEINFLSAPQARKKLGLKGTAKKEIVQRDFLDRLVVEIPDNDIIDAMILAICGVLK